MARDEFSAATKRVLAERAAYFCSSPLCYKLTIGPHSDDLRSLRSGHAAHIRAAAANGPRFDRDQTPEQRRAAANGIWLCRECGDLVDKDDSDHTVDQLERWKRDHEAMIGDVRTKGYSHALELLQAGRSEPDAAARAIALLEDRRAFYARFDAEFPDRVRSSLDGLRHDLTAIRRDCRPGGPMDAVLVAMLRSLREFFDRVEPYELTSLRASSDNPEWRSFEETLRALRKSVILQALDLSRAYGIALTGELAEAARQVN